MKRKLYYLSICILLMGCATLPPVIREIKSEQTIKANFNRVWMPINIFFRDREIPVKNVSTAGGKLETESVKIPYEGYAYKSDYCDCGTLGGIYVYREILGTYTVTVKGVNKSTTEVTFEADYRASLWSGNTFLGWVRCESKGIVEEAFFQNLSTTLQEDTGPKEQPDEITGD